MIFGPIPHGFGHEMFQQREKCLFAILIVNGALESGIKSNEIIFSTAEIGAHKQVESCEIGNTSEQSETVLKMLAAEHQGRFTAILIIWIN